MSDIQDQTFMDEVVQPEDLSLSEDVQLEDLICATDVQPEDLFLSEEPRSEAVYKSDGENSQHSDAASEVSSDSEESNVESVDVISNESLEELLTFFLHLRAVAVAIAREEIALAESSLAKYQKILEVQTMRSTFRQISQGLHTSLADMDTYIIKSIGIHGMSAADRIAARPLFHRAGYNVASMDPPFTRDGLPRAISLPDNLAATEELCSISSLCDEYPEDSIDNED